MNDKKYWEDTWNNDKRWPTSKFAQKAYPIIKQNNLNKMLDLGCGSGRDSLYFADRNLDVTALDFSDSGIKKLKTNNTKQDIECINQDIRDVNFPESTFDVVYAHLSLHYFTDSELEKIIKKLYKSLQKGGYIFIKCKSTKDYLYGKGKKKEEDMFFYKHWRHFFSKEYMKKKLSSFNVVKISESEATEYGFKSSFVEAIVRKE